MSRPDPPAYWHHNERVGDIAVSPRVRLLVSRVAKDGAQYIRVATLRQERRVGGAQWVTRGQSLILPVAVARQLCDLLHEALGPQDRPAGSVPPA
jgi:hypothetical protein